MKKLFNIGNELPGRTILIIELLGFLFFIFVWYAITYPKDSKSIQFISNNPSNINYNWKGPNNFTSDFKGDNFIPHIVPGKYSFSAKDSKNNEVIGTIEVPKDITQIITKDFSKKFGKDSITIKVELKSQKDGWISKAILPPPTDVVKSFKELLVKDYVIYETGYSLILNILGYIEAVILAILLGFTIGLVPFFRALLSRMVNAVRFVPLTAVTGLFIAWFGIESNMKVQFLALGILVYLLPVVVQRIDEVQKTFLQTAYTLGASKWQLIKTVYFPSVASKIIDDIRVLTAISWTYIIIAEMMNQTGGVGALIHLSGRQSRLDKVFALLIIIVLIGIIQDKFFAWLDKAIFKFKYQGEKK